MGVGMYESKFDQHLRPSSIPFFNDLSLYLTQPLSNPTRRIACKQTCNRTIPSVTFSPQNLLFYHSAVVAIVVIYLTTILFQNFIEQSCYKQTKCNTKKKEKKQENKTENNIPLRSFLLVFFVIFAIIFTK